MLNISQTKRTRLAVYAVVALHLGACGSSGGEKTPGLQSPSQSSTLASAGASSSTASHSTSNDTSPDATPAPCPSMAPSASGPGGSVSVGGNQNAPVGDANSSAPGSTTDPNTRGAATNGAHLDPNTFAYAYDKNTSTLPPSENPYPDHILILSQNPNACDDGNFVGKAGEPIITTEWYSFHRIYASPFKLQTIEQADHGSCLLFGSSANSNDTITGTLGGASQSSFEYSLAIDGQAATLHEDPNQSVPTVVIKSCNFPTDANALIPCTQ